MQGYRFLLVALLVHAAWGAKCAKVDGITVTEVDPDFDACQVGARGRGRNL